MDLQSRAPRSSLAHPATTPLWLPPVAGATIIFVLFLAAMGVRQTAIADQARPVMIGLSTAGGVGVAAYGAWFVAQVRERGLGAALGGAIMLFLGVYTVQHVLG